MAVPDDPVRYTDAVLVDDEQRLHRGDVLLHPDGRWTPSRGDEDVVETVDGRDRLITRSLQNWHTHLAMQLNARDFSDGYPLHRWLEEAIFPTEDRLNPHYVETGARAAAAELLRTGCTFAADMYFHPEVTGGVLNDAGMRGLVGGPISDRALPSHDSAEAALQDQVREVSVVGAATWMHSDVVEVPRHPILASLRGHGKGLLCGHHRGIPVIMPLHQAGQARFRQQIQPRT